MAITWLMLIYTVPSQPSRKRAYVWRELKRLGAIYLRDGVALLPDSDGRCEQLETVARRIVDEEGSADLIVAPRFPPERETELIERFQTERLAEYQELYHACVRFLRDVLHDVDAEEFGFPGVENLESELGRLHRWQEQIAGRDYFGAPGRNRVQEILLKCDRAFERFTTTASAQDGEGPAADDVFDRLGGAATREPVPEEYPL